MVRFNVALLLLGTLSASSWAYTPFNPDQLICIGIRDTKPADSNGKCDPGYHTTPMKESEFLSTCFDKGGTWKSSPECGSQSSAPKKYKYSDRKSQQDSYNKRQASLSSPTASPSPAPNASSEGSDTSLVGASEAKGVGPDSENALDQASINAGKASKNERAQIQKDYKAKEKAVVDQQKKLEASRDARKAERKTLNDEKDNKRLLDKEGETNSGVADRQQQLDGDIGVREGKLQAAKDQVDEDRKALRAARKAERKARKDNDAAGGVDDIKKEHDGAYGGNYGGEDVATSQAISMTSTQVSTSTDAVAGQKVQMAAQDREASLRQQGSMNTNLEQINAARRETAEDAKKALNTGGILDMALGAFQAFRAEEHFRSMSNVTETASAAKDELSYDLSKNKTEIETKSNLKIGELDGKISAANKAYKDCGQDNKCLMDNKSVIDKLEDEKTKVLAKKETDLKAEDDNYNARMSNVSKNKREENKSQTNAGVAQGVAAGGMIMQGVQKFQQAAAINAIEAQMAGNAQQYGFAMGGGITQGGGQDGVNALSPIQSAVTTEEEGKKDDLAQNSNINPNDPNLVPEGPPAGAFIESKDQGGGGGGGAGPGMAGGTSADKSAMEAGAQGPVAVTKAGSYAPVAGGAGYKSRNAGGAGKAGVDTGFADLLKKFLPGAEPEKKKGPGELQFGDRSPASNQTAVIGRNKNIFEEISKRYQKKSAEGSVF